MGSFFHVIHVRAFVSIDLSSVASFSAIAGMHWDNDKKCSNTIDASAKFHLSSFSISHFCDIHGMVSLISYRQGKPHLPPMNVEEKEAKQRWYVTAGLLREYFPTIYEFSTFLHLFPEEARRPNKGRAGQREREWELNSSSLSFTRTENENR